MLKVGFYEKEITPPLGDDMPGYSGPRNSTTIHDPLHVKAMAVRTGEAVHECVIIVSLELINVPPKVYDFVMEKVEKWTLVPQKNIMVAAVHSHTAGPTYDDGEFRRPDPAWMEMTCQSAADAAIMAYQRMTDATAKYAKTNVDGLAFCRDYYMKNGEIRTNPKWHDPDIDKPVAQNDTEFPVLFFLDSEGKPMGALANYACHHDSKGGTEISADYSGVLAGKMKDAFGRHFVNVFLQGPCGNVNHCNPFREKKKRDEPAYLTIGKTLAQAQEKLFSEAVDFPIDGVYAEKRVVPIPKRNITEEMVAEHQWILDNVPNDWYQMDINKPENQMFKRTHARAVIKLYNSDKLIPAYIQAIRLGDMYIYAFPGELYLQYGLFLKEKSPTKYVMSTGTAMKGVRGYVPTPDIYESTSYAVVPGSCDIVPEGGQMMMDKAIEIAYEIQEQVDNARNN